MVTYSTACGINLQPQSQGGQDGSSTSGLVDASVVKDLTETHKRMAKKQYQALAEYLQSELPKSASSTDSQLVRELQQQLDTWASEFSDDFLAGIAPRFDANKTRRFASWWNHAREDVMSLYHGQEANNLVIHDNVALDAFINLLTSRADPELSLLVDNLTQTDRSPLAPDMSMRIQHAVASAVDRPPTAKPILPCTRPRTTVTPSGTIISTSIPDPTFTGPTAYASYLTHLTTHPPLNTPAIHIHSLPTTTNPDPVNLTALFLTTLAKALTTGLPFTNKTVLLTGAGEGSISAELARLLLSGGARVIATTSRAPSAASPHFRELYRTHGAKGSELWLVPFNQASARDCEAVVDWAVERFGGVDCVVPFAAAGEGGVEVDGVGPGEEVGLRLMMVNVLRLVGRVVKRKREAGLERGGYAPTQVVVPLSPNRGVFGGDGMYAESKIGLEGLMNRVRSESWGGEACVCGVEIGWTRGTGLMNGNDVVAEAVEREGVVTFSAQEMALNIAVMMAPELVELCEDGPIHADFGGGLRGVDNFHTVLARARQEINLAADIERAVKAQDDIELGFTQPTPSNTSKPLKKKTRLRVGFPPILDTLPSHDIGHYVDPAKIVVVVGFSELGPWGSARLRWQMESSGRFTPEGYVEMAWLMGLIRHVDGPLKKHAHYVGWVDAKTGDPVEDHDMERIYGEHIQSHAGIRFVEKDAVSGYDPARKEYLQEVAVEDDLPPFDTSLAAAEALQLKHGDRVSVTHLDGADTCRVQIKRGATILVPKAIPFPWGSVAGLLPAGFDAARYGIPKDIIDQVDPVTLYALCCVAEAFYSAGLPDPMEVFQHMHLSELGNFIGSSMGGALKTRHLYRDAYLDQEIQADTLQDTYLNTTPAWINMLFLGAAGPIKTPVGACATGLESIDSAMESIVAGKTKMCLVGGYDDFREEESLGFAKMKATVDVAAELARGRLPSEMSRPTAESRSGFVESHGCGVQLLCRADVALDMGLPIYAVLAGSAMAADKIGRSVPAPGQGVLTFAREVSHTPSTPHIPPTHDGVSSSNSSDNPSLWTPLSDDTHPAITTPSSSPLSAALSNWGLTINDLTFASLHGTSTKANDTNEASVLHTQLTHLGRTPGHPVWAICQKSVTGHPKAPAAAWMLNGCLQVLASGLVPGNRNADSVDPALRKYDALCYPTRTMQLAEPGAKAFLLTSFGFGQKGGQVVGVAPRYLFSAALSEAGFEVYKGKVKAREARAEREWVKSVMEGQVVKIKDRPQFEEEDAVRVYLDGGARVVRDGRTGEYRFERNTGES